MLGKHKQSVTMDMYTDYTFQHYDVTMATDCSEDDIMAIVEKLRSSWQRDNVEIKRIIAGFLNRTFICLHKGESCEAKTGHSTAI